MRLTPAERRLLRWSPVLVLGSSVAGLNFAIAYFPAIWAASLWGDAVFALGTVGAHVAALRLARATASPLAATATAGLAAGALTAAVYVASFMLAEPGMDGGRFLALDASGGAPGLVLYIGWPGIAVNGAVAALLAHRAAPASVRTG